LALSFAAGAESTAVQKLGRSARELLSSDAMLARTSFFSLALVGLLATTSDASAGGATIALGEITPPPVSSGVDRALIQTTAEGEIRQIDASKLPPRKVVVSLAMTRSSEAPITCTIHAMLRDERTGNMLAIIEGEARSEGSGAELKQKVASAAVRRAVRLIPDALATK
jgi:hypothetical protein